jgi:hypothetical protein
VKTAEGFVAAILGGRIRSGGSGECLGVRRLLVADLRVDFAVLDAMQRSLVAVAERFEGSGGQVGAEVRIWGGPQVRSAMEEFAENWKAHRGKLTEDIRKLGERCGGTVEVFRGVDAGLAGSVQGSGSW